MDNVLGSITDAPEPDLKIYCGSCEITVHKSVIYPQSEYYARVCEGNPLPEAKTAEITLKGDDPDTVERMVCYLYHKDYQDDEDCQSDTSEPNGSLSAEDQAFETTLNRIVVNIDVYALAEKYDVPPLRALAKAKFTALVCRIRRHEDFSPVFLAIYESSVRRGLELRVIVSRICASRMRAVIDNAQLNGSVKENGNLGRHGSIKKEVERRMRELGLL